MTLNWVTYNKNVTSLEEILMDCERAKRLIHLSLLDKMFSAFSQDDSKYPFLSVTSSILFWFKCTWILQDERSVLYFISKCFLKGWLCVDDLFSQVWMRFDLVLLIFSLMQGSEENQLSFFDDTHIVTKEPRAQPHRSTLVQLLSTTPQRVRNTHRLYLVFGTETAYFRVLQE